MLKNSPALAHHVHGEESQFFFAFDGLGKLPEPSPCPAWWVRNYRAATVKGACVALDVVNVAPPHGFINTVPARKKYRHLHGQTHQMATPKAATHGKAWRRARRRARRCARLAAWRLSQ